MCWFAFGLTYLIFPTVISLPQALFLEPIVNLTGLEGVSRNEKPGLVPPADGVGDGHGAHPANSFFSEIKTPSI